MAALLSDLMTIRDMATALRSMTPDYLDSADMRRAAYCLFTNADGDEMARFDREALAAERHRRALFPAQAPQTRTITYENHFALR